MEPSKTVAEFCKAEKISVSTYYNMKKAGLTPREMRFGSNVRITPEGHAEWRRRMEGQIPEGRGA